MNRKRPLSTEEKRLWHMITSQVKPLRGGHPEPLPQPGTHVVSAPDHMSVPSFPARTPEPVLGSYAGIDRNTAERFRKGDYPLDGTLDLHGFTREKAHKMLVDFIRHHSSRGSRCVLAITGKGVRKEGQTEPRGVLRELLPGWLAEPGLKPMILAFDVAKQRHGGSGAYYILLRRKR